MVIEPSSNSRFRCCKKIASQRIFEALWDGRLVLPPSERSDLHHLFRSSEFAADTAGWFFELLVHQFFRQGPTISLYPILGKLLTTSVRYDDYSASGKIQEVFTIRLPASDDHRLETETELRVGRYYRLPASNFPTIDSLSFTHCHGSPPKLLMFHVTRNNDRCDVNTGDLDKIDQLLPPGAHAYFVVVTPNGVTPRIEIPKSYFPGRGSRNPNRTFPVVHWPVDESTLFPHPAG